MRRRVSSTIAPASASAWRGKRVRLGGGPRVAAIEALPYPALIAGATAVRDSGVVAALAAVLVAFVLAVIIARSMTKPLAQMTRAVEGLSQNAPMKVPTGASGEIGVLAKAFACMDADMREKTAALNREIEERSRLSDNSSDLILTTDHAGKFLRVSPSCKTILGNPNRSLAGPKSRTAAPLICCAPIRYAVTLARGHRSQREDREPHRIVADGVRRHRGWCTYRSIPSERTARPPSRRRRKGCCAARHWPHRNHCCTCAQPAHPFGQDLV